MAMTRPISEQVKFTQEGAGAAGRLVSDKLRETISVKDFGAVGNGEWNDTEAVNAFIAHLTLVGKGNYLIPPGDYLVSSRIDFTSINDQNDGTARNLCISGYGARLVSTLSTGEAFRFNNIKDLTISGLQFATANDNVAFVGFDGCWYSTFNDCKFPLTKFGSNNLDTFESHYWNKFSRCGFKAIEFHLGLTGDRTEFHSNAFYSCHIWAQGSNYAISVFGDQTLNGVDFYNCDVSYYEVGMIYVDQTITSGQLNFYGGYFDGKDGGGNGVNVLRNLAVNMFGFVNNPSSERFDTNALRFATEQVIEGVRGYRNGSRLPVSAVNLIRNGDLRFGIAELIRSSADFTLTEQPGIGLFGKYVNSSITFGTRALSFTSVPLPCDGQYTATVVIRSNGVTAPTYSIRQNGVSVVEGAFAYDGSNWTVSTCKFLDGFNAGDIIEIRIGGASPTNFDIAYAGLTLGSIGLITAAAHPDAVPNGLTRRTSLVTYNPPNLNAGEGVTTTVTAQSASKRRAFLASFSLNLQGILLSAYYNAQSSTASTVGVRLQNETGGVIDLGSGTLRVMGIDDGMIKAQSSVSYNPPSLVNGAGVTTTVTVFGAALGDFAVAAFDLTTQGIIVTAWVSAADTVSVRFQNGTGGVVDLDAAILTAAVLKPCFDHVGSATYDPAAVGVNTAGAGATTTVTATGAALGDFAVASFGQDLQGVLVSAYVSAANTISVRFQNGTGAVTTLASNTLRVGVIKSTIPPTV